MPSNYSIRGDVVWPARLIRPARPPSLIFLDMNHYINMAKVDVGTAPQGYRELRQACRTARADGRALFPLPSTLYMEMSNIRSYRQREDVVAVVEELSDFNYLVGRPQIMRLEIEAAIDALLGKDPSPEEGIPLVGQSALWAFGMRGGLIIKSEGQDAEQSLRNRLGDQKFEQMMAHLNREAERALLTGPDEDSESELRQGGVYAPEVPYQHQEQRAQQEREQADRFDQNPEWRRGRLRDAVSTREFVIELNEMIARELLARNMTAAKLDELLGGGKDYDKARQFTDGMPSTRVAVSLKEHYHRDSRHNWTSNDIHDIDALAVAMPYCDAVFTDAAAWNALKSSPGLEVFDTFLPRRPSELTHWLGNLPLP
ncbi:hypothetical protein HZU40_17215 [Mycolicibacterium fluoranthenivorans]|uniref:Uncharacterized protein n=1 Tax=Mycolicibacterium fluoranthenivorans TaxID=258505 RepID=A0A7G8P6T4_9MYCO|nr:hypothetical protein [Mycolicibacterium fluoranthenivorans]QNJ90050.1 hypothetical protein HZU40_17215 [Mycolicibacterium fluoranthenivorans]